MRKIMCISLAILLLCLAGCGTITVEPWQTTAPTGSYSVTPTIQQMPEPTTTAPAEETTVPATEKPAEHSAYYIPDLGADMLIRYFNEVVLDAEFSDSGDASVVQKWDVQILYYIHGEPTQTDKEYLESTVSWLNSIPGFPGMKQTMDGDAANLQIHFTDEQGMLNLMGDRFAGTDGAVTFWYENNRIYRGIICYRTDIDQYIRNSVIQEEIYNCMGPVQDTSLRSDSMIYSGYSTPQQMTDVDKLIMTLLYHPNIRCGMTAQETEAVIRQLYY